MWYEVAVVVNGNTKTHGGLVLRSQEHVLESALDESYAGYAHRSKHVLKSAWMRVRLAVGSSPLGTPMNSMEVAKPFDAHE